MKNLMILLSLSMGLMSCAFDKKDVKDSQDRKTLEDLNRKTDHIEKFRGVYRGTLTTTQGQTYPILISLTHYRTQGENPQVGMQAAVRYWNTEAIVENNETLTGDLLYGATNTTLKKDALQMDIYLSTETATGRLYRTTGQIGEFTVTLAERNGSFESINSCDEFYKGARPLIFELAGRYDLTLIMSNRPPVTVEGFEILPVSNRNLDLKAYYNVPLEKFQTLQTSYYPYREHGRLVFSSLPGAEDQIQIDTRKIRSGFFTGEFSTSKGRVGRVTLEKKENYRNPDPCPGE